MITTKLVADGKVFEPNFVGYKNVQEGVKALRDDWPHVVLQAHNVCILADNDGCRLILQELPNV